MFRRRFLSFPLVIGAVISATMSHHNGSNPRVVNADNTTELELYLGKLYLRNRLMNIGRRNSRRNKPQKKMIYSLEMLCAETSSSK